MNLERLHKILSDTTKQVRKDDEVDAGTEKVDLEFMQIGVNKEAAEKNKSELIEILNTYPQPDRLAGGPSYIELGAEIGSQAAAFQLFALGKALGLWNIITPASLGITGPEANKLAGSGLIMITGYKSERVL